jgi:hypothetical protein
MYNSNNAYLALIVAFFADWAFDVFVRWLDGRLFENEHNGEEYRQSMQ